VRSNQQRDQITTIFFHRSCNSNLCLPVKHGRQQQKLPRWLMCFTVVAFRGYWWFHGFNLVWFCSGQTALHDIVATRRKRFIGHILQLPPTSLASLAIEWRPEDGKRNIGRPKRMWQDTLKEDLEVMGIDWSDKTTAAGDHANYV